MWAMMAKLRMCERAVIGAQMSDGRARMSNGPRRPAAGAPLNLLEKRARAPYLSAVQFVHQPAREARLGEFLQSRLQEPWTTFRAAVAFVKRSGTKHIGTSLSEFSKSGRAEIIAGIDLHGTSQEGLEDLLDAVGSNGRVIVFHNRLSLTFHPKVYLFKSANSAEVLVGSGNLTEGGLFTNYEASVRLQLDLHDQSDRAFLRSIEDVLNTWADPTKGTALPLNATLLTRLVALGYVPVEALSAKETAEERVRLAAAAEGESKGRGEPEERLFAARVEPRAPTVPLTARERAAATRTGRKPAPAPIPSPAPTIVTEVKGFVMTLHQTDVGFGQITRGTSPRSPEIFIPLSARDAEPKFWGWPDQFTEDSTKPRKFDRVGVRMRVGTTVVSVNMMTWPDKHDFRLRSKALRSAGQVGDIMRIEKVDPASGSDYYVEIVPQRTTQHPVYLARCTQKVRNSKKTYGYY